MAISTPYTGLVGTGAGTGAGAGLGTFSARACNVTEIFEGKLLVDLKLLLIDLQSVFSSWLIMMRCDSSF